MHGEGLWVNPKLIDLITSFLKQFKENNNKISLQELKYNSREDERSSLFLELFSSIYEAYQDRLNQNEEIDFGDMISKASYAINSNLYLSNWKYIIIDEFQDISEGRSHLIQSLLEQNDNTKLFAVGDDWQAIYRFAGSNHQIMKNFRKIFGKSSIVKLDTTFRFNNKISEASEKFITKNPSQIKKKLNTLKYSSTPQVFLHWSDLEIFEAVKKCLSHILANKNTLGKTLQILSRYNKSKLNDNQLKYISTLWKGDVLRQKTVHASKGLEADFVIITDLNSVPLGFPGSKENDPIMNLVLAKEDKYKNSEERRLLYVALTRSREQTHIIADCYNKSSFASELEVENDCVKVIETEMERVRCTKCNHGYLSKKVFDGDVVFYCSNYPICRNRGATCSSCKKDLVIKKIKKSGESLSNRENYELICRNNECSKSFDSCFKCNDGVLLLIDGSNGKFFGCHNYSNSRCLGKKDISRI